ncbi:30S ribosomal protein S3 [Candidatus Roizmanbacteria bacterium RIFCSPHIGHO2_02_FULL_37_15]|uniref:Small ribosomal subunit protein uS3 n=1 Tax=Candidatus Roizmanbacteria bacterium RIFCSPLOWO2_01_FULL_37_16 TaxID=1802058 RepID=A0A1F7IPB0_9BACT|nr:MAG: 30S ribosomal protein S3 [Candidatus Roizmanbacteria bacterium RIFCSPHIGHO2_01_FULL_37_16b]OGK21769.1 MAG: 30S ribosomal protein S3 [Candidatus Roizmanbacteria bacterium RIFCSPHIGHO2_02_FULL_37_15]OGK33710.1 MAG: 30S ribosomal protein S3 [Candidatus Roizmanbacteria bacterium RIFCSPHIGHO2_12_FULL_36_11]OGK45214.1 MAG: 30S ribosomal protein S3 [Candidatus Roizmanbacteria bacterium RIFCSPLOWO2_01_FULL_37_16]
MGQKVHPRGLRLGIIYNWSSRWFFSNKKAYREALLSDSNIRTLLMKKLSFASITQIDIERAINKMTVVIHSVKPGMIIGRGGKGLEEVKKFISSYFVSGKKGKMVKLEIKIEPVNRPYTNSYYVAQTIAEKLVKNFPHRSVVHNTMNRVMEAGAKGVKIQLGGRIAGAEISRREKYFLGVMPTSTIREEVDFAKYAALTKSGYIGVKVWICR